jgi:ubiquinone/menaquinone biosynthesis C-methylase UbiE
LAGWMRDAGLHDVSYRLLTGGIVAIHVGVK